MPPSRLDPNIRYGESGYATVNIKTQARDQTVASRFLDHLSEDVCVRLSVASQGDIALKSFVDSRPSTLDLTPSEEIGNAGFLDDYWDRAPTQKAIYINGPDMAPQFYRDGHGQWWKQTSPCKFTECDDGRGAWCCRNTMKDWPMRNEVDRDKIFAVCSKLNLTDKTCNLHNEAQGKPLQCVMSPLPGDLMFYIKGGKCTVRWTPVERPDE